MIEIIQGTPGSGKSAVSLCLGLDHLLNGGALAANFDLVPHWAWLLSGVNYRVRLGLSDRLKRAAEYRKRCFRIGTAETIFELSEKLPHCGLSSEMQKQREGKGLLILDEAQLIFNSRDFSKNRPWIEFFTQHRKLGWNVLLIAHHIQMIDKQIRPLVELETRFRNLKNVQIPFLPVPLSPVNLFLGVRFYAGNGPGAGLVHGRFLRLLDLRLARLYDTLRVFAFDDLYQSVELQGVDPRISAEALPNYQPDFFLGEQFTAWRKALLSPRSRSPVQRKKRAPGPKPSPLCPGECRTAYGPDA